VCGWHAGECSTLEKQLAEVQASEAGLQKRKAELEAKLEQLEDLLASTTSTRDELAGRDRMESGRTALVMHALASKLPAKPHMHATYISQASKLDITMHK